MKKLVITATIMMLLICTACHKAELDAAKYGDQADTFSLAKVINDNSNIDLNFLGEAEFIEGKCSYVDDGNFSTTMYQGEVKAYAFGYPAGIWLLIPIP